MNWDRLRPADQSVHEAIAAGDYRRALEALVAGYQHPVVGFCTHMLGDAALGEDVAQDVFLAAYAAMPGFHRHASVRTWLFAIARKRCLQVLRNRRRQARLARLKQHWLAAGAHRQPPPSPEAEADSAVQRVQAGLQRLPEAERALLLMRYELGLPLTEVAHILGTSVSSVRRRLARALRRLQEAMADDA
ncbi:MAG: hypothetical protein KatS3mg131_3865 [Candidatus Tectimicrobiota bacterium]|nr:MAG: hypothetical protein KatS3mg131_3865 [Candidatus Tectomicrobia bacterium]